MSKKLKTAKLNELVEIVKNDPDFEVNKDKVIAGVVDEIEKMIPDYDKKKTVGKGVETSVDTTLAITIAFIISAVVRAKFPMIATPDVDAMISNVVGLVVGSIAVSLKKVWTNIQKYKKKKKS